MSTRTITTVGQVHDGLDAHSVVIHHDSSDHLATCINAHGQDCGWTGVGWTHDLERCHTAGVDHLADVRQRPARRAAAVHARLTEELATVLARAEAEGRIVLHGDVQDIARRNAAAGVSTAELAVYVGL